MSAASSSERLFEVVAESTVKPLLYYHENVGLISLLKILEETG